MKKITCFFLFTLFIAACSGAPSVPSLISPASGETVAVTTSIPPTEIPAATSTVVPTETSVPAPLSLDATKSYDQWDLSAFSAEQQAWITKAMTDPDHTPKEAKNYYDQVLIEGIVAQTGDISYKAPLPVDNDPTIQTQLIYEEASRRLGMYVEYLFGNNIHELAAPPPFAWRLGDLQNLNNLVGVNNNRTSNLNYTVEGYDTSLFWPDSSKYVKAFYPSDPNYGNPTLELPWSVQNFSDRTGWGDNASPNPSHQALVDALQFRINGGSATRDTIFGEPSLLIFPRDLVLNGDLMAVMPIAGVSRDVAEEAIVRVFDELRGEPRYIIIRIQYADETIQLGDEFAKQVRKLRRKYVHPAQLCCIPYFPHGTTLDESTKLLHAKKKC